MKQHDPQRDLEALDKARNGITLTNYPAIIEGFAARGIPESDILGLIVECGS